MVVDSDAMEVATNSKGLAEQEGNQAVASYADIAQYPIAQIVHYVLLDGAKAGEHRPAVVVVLDEETGVSDLQVFTNGTRDYAGVGADGLRAFDVPHSLNHEPGTWHRLSE